MYKLTTDKVEFSLDEKGLLTSLKNKETGHNYAADGGLWRIIYSRDLELERMVVAEDCIPKITVSDNSLKVEYHSLTDEDGEVLAFSLTIKVELDDDNIELSAEINNNAAGLVIREFHFPLVRQCKLLDDQRFICSAAGGERYESPFAAVQAKHTQYMAKDNLEVRMSTLYPGFAATNSFVFENDREGLYFGSHDRSFQYTLHLLAADNDGLIPMMVKYPFVKSGETWSCDGYVLSPYSGSWHVASKKYRAWADTWYSPQPRHKMIEGMKGWQRIIMRHQYGEIYYRYDQLEQIFHEGMEANIDTIFMFGWHLEGHDAGYPDYIPDESQGGKAALKRNVEKFQKVGGKVILYFNGQLIDMNTEFYRSIGHKISVKKADGTEHMETYAFGGNGTFLKQFGNKTFVTACPACEEWLDVLKKCIDSAIELGVDGVFFDQLGWISNPCHDASHGHPVPFMAPMKAKADMIEKLNQYVKDQKPDMPLGIEWLSDLTTQHVDFVHNIQKPIASFFLDWFCYTFPEVRISDRGIRDESNFKELVNFSLLKGYYSDVEIYRCRKTIIETPEYCQYLKEINRIRGKYSHLILDGAFRDQDLFNVSNKDILASCFTSENKMAVILTQSKNQSLTTDIEIPGFRLLESDGLNLWQVTSSKDNRYNVELGHDGLALLLFEKETN